MDIKYVLVSNISFNICQAKWMLGIDGISIFAWTLEKINGHPNTIDGDLVTSRRTIEVSSTLENEYQYWFDLRKRILFSQFRLTGDLWNPGWEISGRQGEWQPPLSYLSSAIRMLGGVWQDQPCAKHLGLHWWRTKMFTRCLMLFGLYGRVKVRFRWRPFLAADGAFFTIFLWILNIKIRNKFCESFKCRRRLQSSATVFAMLGIWCNSSLYR